MKEISEKKAALKMSDLARMAGVSKSTVSRALQNSELINVETREMIQRLAKLHNYRLNTQARNFRLKESLTIAVLIPSAENAKWQISDPFFLELLGSISVSLMEKGHDMLLSGLNLHEEDSSGIGLSKINCDGIIVIGQADIHQRLNHMAQTYEPMVVWGAQLDGQHYCTVGGDNLLGGRLATQHLIEQGCRRIAVIGDHNTPEAMLRYQGYERALVNAGLAIDPRLLIVTEGQKDAGYQATLRLLASGVEFDAIFALSDAIAMKAINALDTYGLSVPADIAVVGYDDISLTRYYTPSITSVHQDREIGGRLLVEKLLQILDGHQVSSVILPTNLVVRNSTNTALSLT
ncbi:MAG TPA: LacI family DNA-binding transcriptional regulator [Cellvibrio sp.]|nr:LacI family DNA-binding transcriptional regulator [Cellvibrio sp.]